MPLTNPLPPRRADTLYQDAWLPEELRRIRHEARTFADDVLRPVAHAIDTHAASEGAFPSELIGAMVDAGLYRVPFATDVGGMGLEFPVLATLTVVEELAYCAPNLASVLYHNQVILVGKMLDRAQPNLRMNYLPSLVRGEWQGAFAPSEPHASADTATYSQQTVATAVPGGYRVSGTKRGVTHTAVADRAAVMCKTGQGPTMLLIDLKAPGVAIVAPDRKTGALAPPTSDIRFENLFVPADRVIGTEGHGLQAAQGALNLGRMAVGARGVGMAQAAFDHAVQYACERRVFGQALARIQHWQSVFAGHAAGIEQARALYQKAGWTCDVKGSADIETAMAKLVGSQLALDVARDARQVFEAYGCMRELPIKGVCPPLGSMRRDAGHDEMNEGANEIQKWVIARHIFGREFTNG